MTPSRVPSAVTEMPATASAGTVHPEVAARATPTATVLTKRRNTGRELVDHMLIPCPGVRVGPPAPDGRGRAASGRSVATHPLRARRCLVVARLRQPDHDTDAPAPSAQRPAACETDATTDDHRCLKTEDQAVTAGHSIDPARWQDMFEVLMAASRAGSPAWNQGGGRAGIRARALVGPATQELLDAGRARRRCHPVRPAASAVEGEVGCRCGPGRSAQLRHRATA